MADSTHSDGARPPMWSAFYIDPEAKADGQGTVWRQTSTWWTPENVTPAEALQELLPTRFNQPLWAFAHAMPSNGSWYDLHYPKGVERKLKAMPGDRQLGPHLWVPGDWHA